MQKTKKDSQLHEAVMVSEVVSAFETVKYAHLNNSFFVDATVGLAGHAIEFVKKGIFVIGIDSDIKSLKIAEEVLNKACPVPHQDSGAGSFKLLHGNFADIKSLLKKINTGPVWGILFDLGISSYQLDDPDRGFSFRYPDQILDMRLDRNNQNVKAADMLALLDKRKLKSLFAQVLPDNLAAKIAKAIVLEREKKPIRTIGDFLEIIRPIIRKKGKVDSATLPFLALRMAVNSELENLTQGLRGAFEILICGGRMAVISFHSGEDRIVKNIFKEKEIVSEAVIVTKKPIMPGKNEAYANPRSRSAKLRILQKI